METVEKKDNKIVFKAKMEEGLANSIRRYLNQISVMAIDEIEISKNDSSLYDETIAHRIGLIPLKTKKNVGASSTAELKLDVKREGAVYSGDLKGDIEVVYDNMPIVTLDKDQEIKLTAFAVSGKGADHSKFSPGIMTYRNMFKVKAEKDCPTGVVGVCPKLVFKEKDGKVVVDNDSKCDLCESCTEYCSKLGKDSIKIDQTDELLISLESYGQLDVKDMFEKAVDMLSKDLAEANKQIK